ncbi:MAG: FGGY-family carbohydrate kinase [Candidatus Enteromonas sp.]|nr:FGGY-family carbohydrate kinase [Candidatus Enteromonas sp.]
MRTIAGLDIGTTGAKIVVFSSQGELIERFYAPYPSSRHSSLHEMDPLVLKESVLSLVQKALSVYPNLEGIGVTSFGESFVCLDKDDNPVYPILLYTDPRGKEEVEELVSAFGEEKIERITGLKPHEMYSLPKLAHLAKEAPEKFASVSKVLLMEDYVIYSLSGHRVIDYSLATRTLGFDLGKKEFSKELFSFFGIDPSLLSTPVPAGTLVKGLKEEVFPNKSEFSLAPCGHDQFAVTIGSGVLSPGEAMEGAGTVECIVPAFASFNPGLCKDNYNIVPFFSDLNLTYAFSYTGGAAVDWYVNTLHPEAKETAKKEGKSVYDYLGENYHNEPTGILFLPHLAGAATPYMDLGSKAAFVGLTLGSDEKDLYLSVLEGVAYEMRLNIETLASHGVSIASLIASGGGSKNPIWNQIKADITGIPITILKGEEAGARGSAMLLSSSLGIYPSLGEAGKAFIQKDKVVQPNKEAKRKYDAVYSRYAKLYRAIRPLMEEK